MACHTTVCCRSAERVHACSSTCARLQLFERSLSAATARRARVPRMQAARAYAAAVAPVTTTHPILPQLRSRRLFPSPAVCTCARARMFHDSKANRCHTRSIGAHTQRLDVRARTVVLRSYLKTFTHSIRFDKRSSQPVFFAYFSA